MADFEVNRGIWPKSAEKENTGPVECVGGMAMLFCSAQKLDQNRSTTLSVLFFSEGSYSNDWLNSLRLFIDPVLFINLTICGRFGGKIG